MDKVIEGAAQVDDEFGAVESLALSVEGAQVGAQVQAQERQQEQEAERAAAVVEAGAAELFGALTMARAILAPVMAWWPAYAEVWSDGALHGISDAGAQVMERHGLTMGGLFAEYGPYIALAGATLPPSLATYAAVRERKAGKERGTPTKASDERTEPAPN